jgi:hypothetical protein
MRDEKARQAIDELARLVAGLVIAIKTPAMFGGDYYDRVMRDLKGVCDKLAEDQ